MLVAPILPLFLPALGVDSETAIDLWAGVLNGTTSFVAAFASPLWGQLADRHDCRRRHCPSAAAERTDNRPVPPLRRHRVPPSWPNNDAID